MNKLKVIIREQSVLLLFGFILTISLFLGDGKQPAIDVAWACEILLLYAIYFLQNRKPLDLPRGLHFVWILLLGYCVSRSIFSDSVGYSVSAAVRLFDAYLVYRLFYLIADKQHTRHVSLGIVIIGVVGSIASFGCLLFPRFVSWLPQMNLLYATYGHNELAGLLLFCIPMVVAGKTPLPSWCKKAVFVLFLLSFVFSFARGAWILLAAYLAFLFFTKRLTGKFYLSTSIVFVGAAAGLLVFMSFLASPRVHVPSTLKNDWFYKQTIKHTVYESRIQYWVQAWMAIRERPIFGSGPGTFYLLSKRFQSNQNGYSWFAHNFVLEQFAELGVVGMLFWGVFFAVQWRRLRRSRDSALLAGVILTFLYSFFEYNLNFLVIWLLFWSAIGWITGSESIKTSSPRPSLLTAGGLVLLLVFSLFSVGEMIETVANKSDAASLFAPFIADVAETSLNKHAETGTPEPQQNLSLIVFFHKKNPEILYDLARASPASFAPSFYGQAIVYDPQNTQYMSGFIEFLLKENNRVAVGALIETFGERVLPEKSKPTAKQIPFTSPEMNTLYSSSLFKDVGSDGNTLEYLSKIYYFLGLAAVKKDPVLTERLWSLARDSAPDWGYFYVELASLSDSLHNNTEAKLILRDCQTHVSAATECKNTQWPLPKPGSLQELVKLMPITPQ